MGEATDILTTTSGDATAAALGADGAATMVGRSRLPSGLKLPANPALARFPILRAAFRLQRPGRAVAADLVFAAGAASLVLSVLFVVNAPELDRLHARSDEATVVANAATLQLAAESYAALNGGRYPRDVLELLPLLPEGAAPRNPYTNEPTVFRGVAGDITYRPVAGGSYVIEAWGRGAARTKCLVTLRGTAPRRNI
jgi:hypothetical protein